MVSLPSFHKSLFSDFSQMDKELQVVRTEGDIEERFSQKNSYLDFKFALDRLRLKPYYLLPS